MLHIPRWYPHRDDPMLGLFVKNHVASLEGKCKNSILYMHFVENQEKVIQFEQSKGDDIFLCIAYIRKSSLKLFFLNQLINAFRYFRAFRRSYRLVEKGEGKPHLVHVHVLTRPAIPALWLKYFQSIPYLISEHWSRYFPEHNDFKGLVRKGLTQLAIQKAMALVCVSGSLYQAMNAHGFYHKKYYTVPNVVDTKLFKPAEESVMNEITKLIHISCFEDKSKNISGLLKAIHVLKTEGIRVAVDLLGDGPDKDNLESLAQQLELTENEVRFHGMLMPAFVKSKLQEADFLIQTSYYETFSTVVVESLACGVPVISTPVGIFSEIFNPEIGFLIPSTTPDEIAKSIVLAISSQGKYNKMAMTEIARKLFSNESVGESLFAIYLEILKKNTD